MHRLHGVGPYTIKNVTNTLRLLGLVQHDVGCLGPGACEGAIFLRTGAICTSRCSGLLPWHSDRQSLRDVVATVAKRKRIHFMDAQGALCYWMQSHKRARAQRLRLRPVSGRGAQ